AHGRTWQRGDPVGRDMDETTIAQLPDGRARRNSRHHAPGGHRRVAVSAAGGLSWPDHGLDAQFLGPGNNADAAGQFPDAAPEDRRAQVLLLTNTWDACARRRGTVSVSGDDGCTWAESLVFEPGPLDYSVVQALDDGAIGIIWEVEAREIRFARLEADTLV